MITKTNVGADLTLIHIFVKEETVDAEAIVDRDNNISHFLSPRSTIQENLVRRRVDEGTAVEDDENRTLVVVGNTGVSTKNLGAQSVPFIWCPNVELMTDFFRAKESTFGFVFTRNRDQGTEKREAIIRSHSRMRLRKDSWLNIQVAREVS